MKKWLWLLALAVILAPAACNKEEEEEPPGPEPSKENTVQLLLSNAWDPCYSPQGNKIVFVEAYHLAVYDVATRTKTVITPEYGSAELSPRKPAWLVGDLIAFVMKPAGSTNYAVYTVPAAGGTITQYAVDTDKESSLAGDSTGNYVFFTLQTDLLLYRLTLATSVTEQVTHNHITDYGHFDPVQRPNTDKIYYLERMMPFQSYAHPEYLNEIKVITPGGPTLLLNTDKPFLEGLTSAPDDKYLIFCHRDGLFAYERNSGTETWLTRAPDKWTDKDRNPSYSSDGTTIAFTRANNIYTCEAP